MTGGLGSPLTEETISMIQPLPVLGTVSSFNGPGAAGWLMT